MALLHWPCFESGLGCKKRNGKHCEMNLTYWGGLEMNCFKKLDLKKKKSLLLKVPKILFFLMIFFQNFLAFLVTLSHGLGALRTGSGYPRIHITLMWCLFNAYRAIQRCRAVFSSIHWPVFSGWALQSACLRFCLPVCLFCKNSAPSCCCPWPSLGAPLPRFNLFPPQAKRTGLGELN